MSPFITSVLPVSAPSELPAMISLEMRAAWDCSSGLLISAARYSASIWIWPSDGFVEPTSRPETSAIHSSDGAEVDADPVCISHETSLSAVYKSVRTIHVHSVAIDRWRRPVNARGRLWGHARVAQIDHFEVPVVRLDPERTKNNASNQACRADAIAHQANAPGLVF